MKAIEGYNGDVVKVGTRWDPEDNELMVRLIIETKKWAPEDLETPLITRAEMYLGKDVAIDVATALLKTAEKAGHQRVNWAEGQGPQEIEAAWR
jgi:hypothetical protein